MRGRGVVLQGVLAVMGLAAAFVVWRREPPEAPGAVVVLAASERVLERVRYEDAAGWVELHRERGGDGPLELRLGRKEGEPPAPPRVLRANETARRLFDRFAPLWALRSLGVLDAGALAEVGLADSPRRLTVVLEGRAHAFSVAASSSGWGSPYLRREPDGEVFLLSPSLLPDLEGGAGRLVDRALHAFGTGGFDALTVTRAERARSFQVLARERRPAELVPRQGPPVPDEMARRWHERLWLLAPAQGDVLGRGEVPPGGPPRELFRVDYQRGTTVMGHLLVARGEGGALYARTEHTVGWARLPAWAESLVAEVEKVLPPI